MSVCSTVTDLGVVRDVLTAVDCNTRSFAQLGYESLAAANSPFQAALTVTLTIYVVVIGYRLLFGEGVRLSDGPVIALKIGAVLALVTSWSLFQTLVFDLADRAPMQIASVIAAPMRGHGLAADPVAGLQASYDQLSQTAAAFAHPPKAVDEHAQANYATAAQALNMAANGLFMASAGLISVLLIAIGLLTATGPLFIAMFLFFETRGLFVGWVRALAASAFGLLSAWSLTILMLHAAEPWLDSLADGGANGLADPHTGVTTAIIVLVFCAAQFGLMLAGIMIARGFRLPVPRAAACEPDRYGKHRACSHAAGYDFPPGAPGRAVWRIRRRLRFMANASHATATSMIHARREGSSPGAADRNAHRRLPIAAPPSGGKDGAHEKASERQSCLPRCCSRQHPRKARWCRVPARAIRASLSWITIPTQVVELNATMGYQTFIEFSADEQSRMSRWAMPPAGRSRPTAPPIFCSSSRWARCPRPT